MSYKPWEDILKFSTQIHPFSQLCCTFLISNSFSVTYEDTNVKRNNFRAALKLWELGKLQKLTNVQKKR